MWVKFIVGRREIERRRGKRERENETMIVRKGESY